MDVADCVELMKGPKTQLHIGYYEVGNIKSFVYRIPTDIKLC
jgi:hypothetical protein